MTIAFIVTMFFVFITGIMLSYARGLQTGSKLTSPITKELTTGCPHIWGQWEYFEQGIWNNEGKHLYNASAQKRQCEFCGYLEYEPLRVIK